MAQHHRESSHGYMRQHGGGNEETHLVIQTVLQQMDSLHRKVDTLNDKVENLTIELTRCIPIDNHHPQIILQPGSPKTEKSASNDTDTRQEFNGMDNLDVNDELADVRSSQSSYGSTDSSYMHVSGERNTRNSVSDRCSDSSSSDDEIDNVEKDIKGKIVPGNKANVESNDTGSDETGFVIITDEHGEHHSDDFIRNTVRASPTTQSETPDIHNNNESDPQRSPLTNDGQDTDHVNTDGFKSGIETNILDTAKSASKGSKKERVKITPVISDSDDTDNDEKEQDLVNEREKQQQYQLQLVQSRQMQHQQYHVQQVQFDIDPQNQRQHTLHHQQTEYTHSITPDEAETQEEGFVKPNKFDDNESINVDDNEDHKASDQTSFVETYSRKRPYSVNIGSRLPQPRSASPVPVARNRVRIPYSYFKRRRTVIFDDNRSKYFDKMLDIESFSGTEDVESNGYQEEEPVNRLEAESLPTDAGNQATLLRNNEQLPVSGYKHEHGPEDNRFTKEAHTDCNESIHHQVHGNITFIQPNHTFNLSTVQQGSSKLHGNTTHGPGERRIHSSSRVMVTDAEIHTLIEKEQHKALECSDPKSMHGMDTVICLDTSASMKGKQLEKAKQFISQFLNGLEKSAAEYSLEENVALVTFGRENQVLQHLTNNYDLIHSSLKTVKSEGPSPLWLGIGLCLTELSKRGGACTMDSIKVLPRIIVISDFVSSVKNLLFGPDIEQMDTKANSEVSGIIEKNRNSVSSFDFVIVGTKYNQVLLDQIGRDRVFTLANVLYLSQFFRTQDVVNEYLTKAAEQEVGEEFLKGLMEKRGLSKHSEKDVMQVIKEKSSVDLSMDTDADMAPNDAEADQEEPEFGTRVKVNPDWVGSHTRSSLSGTVIAPRKLGCLKILWEDGTQERLKYGVNGEYEIIVDDVETDMGEEENLKVGSVVERGNDWRWGEQDGGPGNIGVVSIYDQKKNVVTVLWDRGGQGNYRYGYRNKYDVVLRSVLPRDSDSDDKRPFWQMKLDDDNWMFLSPDVNKMVETKHSSEDRNTFLVNFEDVPYRFSVKSLIARNTTTNSNHSLQRLELTRAEWLSMTSEP